jgi:hypothetical protein
MRHIGIALIYLRIFRFRTFTSKYLNISGGGVYGDGASMIGVEDFTRSQSCVPPTSRYKFAQC